jgi:hypothetical protein
MTFSLTMRYPGAESGPTPLDRDFKPYDAWDVVKNWQQGQKCGDTQRLLGWVTMAPGLLGQLKNSVSEWEFTEHGCAGQPY